MPEYHFTKFTWWLLPSRSLQRCKSTKV